MSNLTPNTSLVFTTTKTKLYNALNFLDGLAEYSSEDIKEKRKQADAYELLYNLITELHPCEHKTCDRIAQIHQDNYCTKHN